MTPPVKNLRWAKYPKGDVTQWFGESAELYQKNVCIDAAPCHSSMVCPPGKGCLIAHNGIDIVRPYGEPIYAIEGGIVTDIKDNPDGYGRMVRILTDEKEGKRIEWTYGHASENLVKLGDKITEGQMIQRMGNSGFVVSGATPFWEYNPFAGTHLHLGKRIYKNGVCLEYNNGYFGSIDFYDDFKSYVPYNEDEIRTLQLTVISLANEVIRLLQKLLKGRGS